jgi:RimJ/RimL family protein N-acetyltransferase
MTTEFAEVSMRPLNEDCVDDFKYLAAWENDPAIRHLIRPHKNEESLLKTVSEQDLFQEHIEACKYNSKRGVISEQWLLCVDGEPVGHGSLMMNPPHRVTKTEGKVAWFGLEIGVAAFRGKGYGKRILHFLEDEARKQGAALVEVGVFEFNEVSLNFFKSQGYAVVDRLEHFSFWKGQMWADLRLTKRL